MGRGQELRMGGNWGKRSLGRGKGGKGMEGINLPHGCHKTLAALNISFTFKFLKISALCGTMQPYLPHLY